MNYLKVLKVLKKISLRWTGIKTTSISCRFKYRGFGNYPSSNDRGPKEAVGSMGDDTPIAVLSSKFRPLSHFFRQNFSQVTNPPIDSLGKIE